MPSDLELAAEIERLKERVAKLEAFCFGGVEAFATGTETNSGSARWLTKPLHVSDRSEMVPVEPNPPPAEPGRICEQK